MDIKRMQWIAYELYKVDWMSRIDTEQRLKEMRYYYNSETYSEITFEDYISENGYNGELYVCFDEFINDEFLDNDYMKELLGQELFCVYKNLITQGGNGK